ncbi:metallophosphoesterase family protein [Oxynema aestuarii]|uniref:Nuclease SbcCD subunit D n=1 Tax=Oxynema aestuarii AP17 TaxID=2064643 RepID=A0A6H1TRN8_9CYAN|nr:exonuclease SbcCD subunit D C-terminal domain-containing protein [Oxynema aestuarii]QIZ69268.1 exonuclease subunit SbcD [Oxynema aestuarii AP17]RMH75689.1 MAG: exonuclease subunit SbcD [Cyanobacteria bacterium J007]
MRLIHTADWHLGRRLKGIDRTPEVAGALQQILVAAKELEVDAVLIAGDIFDIPNPPAYAERVAYEFFCGLQEAGIPAVAIAGNHDSATRIDGLANLLSLAGVRALGKPRPSEDGGAIILNTKSGKLCVGALPFASERRMLDASSLWMEDEEVQNASYRSAIAALFKDLTSWFAPDRVNILMGHLAIEGAKLAESEVMYYSQDKYALGEQTLPEQAQYIALGHIHIHQQVRASAPTYYSGSLIQIDFGEAEQEKGFCLIEVEPGGEAKVEFKPVLCQRPLKQLFCDLDNLEETLEANRYHPGFLKVIVNLDSPVMGLGDRVRQICPQTLQIVPNYPEKRYFRRSRPRDRDRFDPIAEFENYYRDTHGRTAPAAVVGEFENLYRNLREKGVGN